MPKTTVSVRLVDLPGVQQTHRAMMLLLHEIEASDAALIPDSVLKQAAETRAVVDEWRLPGRHRRRHDRD